MLNSVTQKDNPQMDDEASVEKLAREMSKAAFDGSDDLFFSVVSKASVPVILTDPNTDDNPVCYCNDAVQAVTGYTVEEMVGHNPRMLQGDDTDPETVDKIRRALSLETEYLTEILNYRKDGKPFWNKLYISPVRNRHGKLIYYFSSVLDITTSVVRRRVMEQQQKNELLGQLVGGIAHDFNNMLAIISGNVQMIQNGLSRGQSSEEIGKYADRAMTAISQTDKLTSQLLTFARKSPVNKASTDINEVVGDVAGIFERLCGENIKVHYNLIDDPLPIDVDQAGLNNALLAVLFNAQEAIDASGAITILTDNVQLDHRDLYRDIDEGCYVVLKVTDTGKGMSSEIREQVFDPFFTTKGFGKGNGMGMATVQGFIEQMKARVHVESEEGKGTTIAFYFPCDAEGFDVSRTQPKVLIIDESADLRRMVAEFLRDNEFNVRHAQSRAEADIILGTGYKPDVCLIDIGAQGVAERIRKSRPNCQTILTSAWAVEDVDADVLHKPYDLNELLSRVKAILEE